MIRHPVLAFASMLLVLASASRGHSTASDAKLRPADIDALTGPPWVGTLTYLDYTSHEHTTIDSSLIVRRTSDAPPSWEFGTGYAKEPHADAKEIVSLSADGGMLGDERVVSRTPLPGGGVLFVTETDGEDDHRPARFRFEHSITTHENSRRKLVRFDGETEFFERHVYRWKRAQGAPQR